MVENDMKRNKCDEIIINCYNMLIIGTEVLKRAGLQGGEASRLNQ